MGCGWVCELGQSGFVCWGRLAGAGTGCLCELWQASWGSRAGGVGVVWLCELRQAG